MRVLHVVAETPASFLQHLKDLTFIEKKPLKYVLHIASDTVLTKGQVLLGTSYIARPYAGTAKAGRIFRIAESSCLCNTSGYL